MREPELRPELAAIVTGRYGAQVLTTVTHLVPSDEQIKYYTDHMGMLTLGINLEHDPHLIVIDTGRLTSLRHAWIAERQRLSFNLHLASENQPVSETVRRIGTFTDQRVEGIELTIHYNNPQRRNAPYTDRLVPLW